MAKSNRNTSFLENAKSIIEEHLTNELFGVSELAEALHISRSNLHRKIRKEANCSASQFIREIRLKKAAELLIESELTASEIAFEVGFSNTSYFTKCYREYFGYPPGETKIKIQEQNKHKEKATEKRANKESFVSLSKFKIIIGIVILLTISILYFSRNYLSKAASYANKEKSIAVLPFKNLSEDTSDLYFINGIMEASLNNLQKIRALQVVSGISTKKYGSNPENITKVGKDLRVNYLIQGSGQKLGNSVLVKIQLIDVEKGSSIWSEQYQYQLENVFSLQNTIAKKIANAIEANITPNELANIDKNPTTNIIAYEHYLKGIDYQNEKTEESLKLAIESFKKAIQEDTEFTMAYAQIAISYYFLDNGKANKKHLEKLTLNANQALLLDSKLELSLIAKALSYISISDFKLAISNLEKALEYNPNSSFALLLLSNMYSQVDPNSTKHLTYILKGVKLNIEANDSITKSNIYLNLSQALAQNGFTNESLKYLNESLSLNPNNPFASLLKYSIQYYHEKDLTPFLNGLLKEWEKDTTRIDIAKEIGKIYYYKEDYKKAYHFYTKYLTLKANRNQIEAFPLENLKIAIVYEKMGEIEKAKGFLNTYRAYIDTANSKYKEVYSAALYIYENDFDAAIDAFQKFSTKKEYQYSILLDFEKDPLIKKLKSHPKYNETLLKIESQFWKKYTELSVYLENNNLL